MAALIETHDLQFKALISYPDLAFRERCVTLITGASGCGKSTLLHLMNGTLSPSAGQICYDGADIAELDTIALRRDLLLVRQAPFLFDASISENFAQFYAYRDKTPPTHAELLQDLRICCADFPPEQSCATLSGGERQRVFLAVGLSLAPRALLLDEPTSALDAKSGTRLMEQLTACCKQRGITLILVSHDADLAERFAEERVHLERQVGA